MHSRATSLSLLIDNGISIFRELTSAQIEILKWMGVVAMILDHVGLIFYPDNINFRIAGRIAYPIFGFVLIHNYIYFTKNKLWYIKRLFFLALATEPFHMLLFWKYSVGINVFFMYSLVLASVYILEGHCKTIENSSFKKTLIAFIFALFMVASSFIGYFIVGYLLILSFYFSFKDSSGLSFMATLILLTALTYPVPYYVLGTLATLPVIFLVSKFNIPPIPRIKIIFYMFYPVHVCVILLLKPIG